MIRRNLLRLLGAGATAGVFGKSFAQDKAHADWSAIPYPRIETTGKDALATWTRLRDEGKGWPVIVGDDEALRFVAEQFAQGGFAEGGETRDPAAIIRASANVRLPDALRDGYANQGTPEDPMPPLEKGEWPAQASPEPGLTIASEVLTGRPFARVHILVLPTQHGFEVPAYLKWGGWNECPSPEMHVAVLRRWHAQYGAELIGISNDVLNLRATRRPATRADALMLAEEQTYYCIDIVDQGVGSVSALAAGLMASDWWYFWWD